MRATHICLFVLFLSAIALSISCDDLAGICENTFEKEVISPDGRSKAVLYDRGCGATVGFITGISIFPVEQKLSNSDTGNVLLAGNAAREFWNDNSNSIVRGKMNFDLKWDGNNTLLVYFSESKFLNKHEKFGNIDIRFMPISQLAQ